MEGRTCEGFISSYYLLGVDTKVNNYGLPPLHWTDYLNLMDGKYQHGAQGWITFGVRVGRRSRSVHDDLSCALVVMELCVYIRSLQFFYLSPGFLQTNTTIVDTVMEIFNSKSKSVIGNRCLFEEDIHTVR